MANAAEEYDRKFREYWYKNSSRLTPTQKRYYLQKYNNRMAELKGDQKQSDAEKKANKAQNKNALMGLGLAVGGPLANKAADSLFSSSGAAGTTAGTAGNAGAQTVGLGSGGESVLTGVPDFNPTSGGFGGAGTGTGVETGGGILGEGNSFLAESPLGMAGQALGVAGLADSFGAFGNEDKVGTPGGALQAGASAYAATAPMGPMVSIPAAVLAAGVNYFGEDLGLNQPSTAELQTDKTKDLQEAGIDSGYLERRQADINAREANNGLGQADKFIDEKGHLTEAGLANPASRWGTAGMLETFGNDYFTKMSEQDRYAVTAEAMKLGLLKPSKGDWDVTDPEALRAAAEGAMSNPEYAAQYEEWKANGQSEHQGGVDPQADGNDPTGGTGIEVQPPADAAGVSDPLAGLIDSPNGEESGKEEPVTKTNTLWKPSSDSDGNLVVLFPSKVGSVTIKDAKTGQVLDTGRPTGASNGYAETVRFSKPGSQFKDVIVEDDQGNSYYVPDGGQRQENLKKGGPVGTPTKATGLIGLGQQVRGL